MLRFLQVKQQRYSVWAIFWIVTAIQVAAFIFGLVVIIGTSTLGKDYDWNKFFSLSSLVKQASSILSSTAFFYYTLNLFNRLFVEKKKLTQFIPAVLMAMGSVVIYHICTYVGVEITVNKKVVEKAPVILLVFGYAFTAFFLTGISLLIAYLNTLRDGQQQRKILEQQKMELEIEKSQANLNFLKAQINPHFLHNTLNFLYAKALPLSEELSEGIATLSDIMRYALSNANTTNGQAALREEIEHVENVIKINQLRFSNNLKVHFEVTGVVNGAKIIPFVLITLVENAFKHGDLRSPEHPIEIRIDMQDHGLFFYCRNRKKTGSKELSTGLGLDNIKKRLELAYGSGFNFYVKDGLEFYTTELTIHQL